MTAVSITGLGTYLPRRSVRNAELPTLDPPHSVEQLDALGILARGWADDDEGVVEMADHASREALKRAEVDPSSLDFVLLANWSERRYVPDVAPRIAAALGANRAFAYDLCGACCGFIMGMATAWGFLQRPNAGRGLVVASDASSRRMRPATRSTIVFGDGAAAAVLDGTGKAGWEVVDFELRTDGKRNDIMEVDPEGYLKAHIRQSELNPLAGSTMAEVARTLLDRNALSLDDIDYVVPHSGTAGVQKQLREHLGVSEDKVLTNLPLIGNVTTASIPCSLEHFSKSGQLAKNQTILCVAVGLGWQSVAMLLRT